MGNKISLISTGRFVEVCNILARTEERLNCYGSETGDGDFPDVQEARQSINQALDLLDKFTINVNLAVNKNGE